MERDVAYSLSWKYIFLGVITNVIFMPFCFFMFAKLGNDFEFTFNGYMEIVRLSYTSVLHMLFVFFISFAEVFFLRKKTKVFLFSQFFKFLLIPVVIIIIFLME